MPDDNYYQERGEERNWPKVALIVLGVIILVLIIFLLIRGCGKNNGINGDLEDKLLKAGKEYYSIDDSLLPQATGECKTVTLGSLVDEQLLNNDDYTDCNKDKTYVKVCKLESGNYHYLPVMQCGSKLADDYFTTWKEGNESDLVADKSDVRFAFLGERLEISDSALGSEETAWLDELNGVNYKTVSSTKYYRYRDLTWKWQLTDKDYYGNNSYYTSSPSSDYTNTDGSTTGWKWYTEVSGNVWSKISNPTVKKSWAFQKTCTDKNQIIQTAASNDCASYGTGFFTVMITYTCDGVTALTGDNVDDRVCSITCPSGQILSNDKKECGNYVSGTTRKYYPSNSTSASGENTYYVSAPTSGAKKDESTQASVSRYYKANTTISGYSSTAPSSDAVKVGDGVWGSWSSYQTTQPKAYTNTRQIESRTQVTYQTISGNVDLDNWVAISDNYLSENDLIAAFKDLQYEIETLEDIESANDLRYKVKLEYRNRK